MSDVNRMHSDHKPDQLEKQDTAKKGSIISDYDTTNMDVYGHSEPIEFTNAENKRVKRKIDFVLLPLMFTCYVFSVSHPSVPNCQTKLISKQFLDKTLLNYALIFGIKDALHLKGSNYSWLGRVYAWLYNLGKTCSGMAAAFWKVYHGCCAELVMHRSTYTFVFQFSWDHDFTSNWWTRPEQAFRTAFWLSGTPVGNFIGGVLTYGLGSIQRSIATWKIFFLFFGSFSFVFSLLLMYLMPDNQANPRWLDDRQKKIAIERVRENQTVTADDRWKWPQFWEALKDPQTTFFFRHSCINSGNTMPSTFASQFSSQIVKGFGFTAMQTTIISTCPAAVIQLAAFLGFSFIASHHNNIRLLLSIIVSIPPLIGASLLHTLPADNQAGRLAGYYLTYTHSMSFTLSAGLMASNYAGSTKKSTASGVIFAGWAAGLIAGPQFFLDSEAPVYTLAFKMLMGCYALMIILPVLQLAWYKYENARRDKLARARHIPTRINGPKFTDLTDFEQWETFRYTM
ncbi:hypothetical protein G7046_g2404 [Stylonectria norvegica]|nr:hypothetical protein G7046_g2404 [Stylonectria norvegica]